MMHSRLLLTSLVVCAPLIAAAQDEEGPDPFPGQLDQYEEYLRRGPLLMHTRGRIKFAKTEDTRALQILADSYAKPEQPKELVQYLIAGIATRHCVGPEHVGIYDAWRESHAETKDAWLWYRALSVHGTHNGSAELLRIAREHDDVFMRAAGIEALAAIAANELIELVPEIIETSLPNKMVEKAVLIGALGTGLRAHAGDANTPSFRRAAAAFAHLLDEEHELPLSNRLVVARQLADIYDIEELLLESAAWLSVMAGAAHKATDDGIYLRPTFFGLQGSGTRICYVIDMSDSMCKPIDPEMKPKGPASGPKKKRKKGELPTADDIPWQQIENRFDLAREHLKISLQRLDKEKSFCVIYFGDRADMLRSCNGMMQATRSNVAKVIKELDGIDTGSPNQMRPDGTLRGMTNLHGGLRRAFMVKKKGFTKEPEYIDFDTFTGGCDTIFLLSDGAPTWDDWDCKDQNYGEDNVGDPESHIGMPEAANMHYSGPYVDRWNLLEDVERMNLFREVEINCIGIGEARMQFLQNLARLGLGKVQQVGG